MVKACQAGEDSESAVTRINAELSDYGGIANICGMAWVKGYTRTISYREPTQEEINQGYSRGYCSFVSSLSQSPAHSSILRSAFASGKDYMAELNSLSYYRPDGNGSLDYFSVGRYEYADRTEISISEVFQYSPYGGVDIPYINEKSTTVYFFSPTSFCNYYIRGSVGSISDYGDCHVTVPNFTFEAAEILFIDRCDNGVRVFPPISSPPPPPPPGNGCPEGDCQKCFEDAGNDPCANELQAVYLAAKIFASKLGKNFIV